MADKTSNGASGRSDLDPFAELTRIMGFDPRVPVGAAAEAESKSVQAAKPVSEPAISVKESQPDAEEAALDIDLERELLGALDRHGPAASDAPQAIDIDPPTLETADLADDQPVATGDDLDLHGIEDEISKHVEDFIAVDRAEEPELVASDQPAPEANTVEEVPVEAAELEAPAAFFQPMSEYDAVKEIHPHSPELEDQADGNALTSALADELDLEQSLNDAFADTTPHPRRNAEWEPTPFLSARPQPMAVTNDDRSLADVDMNFDAADAEQAELAATSALEAEYNALLGNIEETGLADTDFDVGPSKQREAEIRTASIVSGGWRKPAAVSQVDDVRQPVAYDHSDRIEEREEGETSAEADLDLDLANALESAVTVESDRVAPEPPVVKSEPITEDPFAALAAMAARYQTGPQENAWREAASKYEAQQPAASEPAQPTVARSYAAPGARPVAPAIETVDVQDNAIALADDLEIPELAYEEPPIDRYDDLDAEFNNLLNEMSTGERRAPTAHTYARSHQQHAYADEQPVRSQPSDQRVRPEPISTHPAYRDEPYHAISDDDFENAMAAFDAEADDEEDFDQPVAPPAEKRPRRGLWLAAVVGGLALIGGISAVALSFGGSGISEIAMVKADGKPVKVRPENPGGSTVPTQGSTVYETVSRSGATDTSAQERLVDTVEEPLDLPSLNNEEVEDDVAAISKDEDRVEPTLESDVAAQETIAVAPRKVRTMVVKSDGTLVPREEPVEPQQPQKPAAAVEDELGTEQITTGATKPSAPATPEPATVAAVPAALEKPATAPVAGGWSIQVSSQPSEDGANKSLKDISRKYAGVIGDRSPNIVKAEVDGKGTMYRVRIPASSRDEAIRLCGDLKAAGGSCFVTK
ncbi:MAG: SPOR domain-containing protein [Rhizobiaceae bacterium]